jgi:hypothetical protein
MTVVIVVLVVLVLAAGAFVLMRRRHQEPVASDPNWAGGPQAEPAGAERVADPHHGEVGGRGSGGVGGL